MNRASDRARLTIVERSFEDSAVLDVAIRRSDGTTAVDLGCRVAPPLPVDPALSSVLPSGLRRGSTLSVTGSISLLLALLGTASADGAWCALVGLPWISAEAAAEYGLDLARLAVVPTPGARWTTVVGALLDAVDVVAARPPRARNGPSACSPADVRRLAARARTRDTVLVAFGEWPGADVRLQAEAGHWAGIGTGTGRLRARRVQVSVQGRGQAARPRSASLWLPAAGGGIATSEPLAPVVELAG
jgi:hypothetical protein